MQEKKKDGGRHHAVTDGKKAELAEFTPSTSRRRTTITAKEEDNIVIKGPVQTCTRLTTPSKYMRQSGGTGRRNPQFRGEMVALLSL